MVLSISIMFTGTRFIFSLYNHWHLYISTPQISLFFHPLFTVRFSLQKAYGNYILLKAVETDILNKQHFNLKLIPHCCRNVLADLAIWNINDFEWAFLTNETKFEIFMSPLPFCINLYLFQFLAQTKSLRLCSTGWCYKTETKHDWTSLDSSQVHFKIYRDRN